MKPIFCLLLLLLGISGSAQIPYKYKNRALNVEERVQDLLSLMTLEEKVGQLLCPLGWEMYEKQGDSATHSKKFETLVQQNHIGMLWAVFRADPWTQKTLQNGLNPELAARAANALQRYAVENTRLGIPLFLAEECPHGHMAIGTTVFPTGIGMASTWNPELIKEIGAAVAKEIRWQGGHIGYGPVLDLSRDPRWSRAEETFGEDPVLAAVLGAAFVKGAGGGDLKNKQAVISTLKHFVAYGVPESGINGNAVSMGVRELQENFLPPFKAAIDAGAQSVMSAYNSIDGIPCTSNSYLFTDILRKQWNFRGFSVSDLISIDALQASHFVAQTLEEAAIQSLSAGVDVDLGGNAYQKLVDAVQQNWIREAVIDTAVCRVLRLKFEMGLFENPYVDPALAKQHVRKPAHVALARDAARESVVLLENKNHTLPLHKDIRKVAVIGPNADNVYNMLGDYTAPQDEHNVITVLKGIQSKLKPAQIEYVKGCAIRDTSDADLEKAVNAARNAEVAVVVVGGSSARDFKTDYAETGAAVASATGLSDMDSGEGFDRATLDLLGKQKELLQAIKQTGKPLIVIYIQGRPLNMNWAAEQADALLTAWYPGQEGGNAIADVLFGDYNPAGRLPLSVPRHEGQIPVYYNKKNPPAHDYIEMTASPLYAFGYGLSYTSFAYADLVLKRLGNHDFEISCSLTNSGAYDGGEVVQLYLRDEVASVVQPVKQLKQFQRIHLKKGETKQIVFKLTKNDFCIFDRNMNRVVEPGEFTVMIGSASDHSKLTAKITIE